MLALSIRDVAVELGRMHPSSVRRLIARGDLVAVRVGRRVLIPGDELERFLRAAPRRPVRGVATVARPGQTVPGAEGA
jgi:excisionase family DNA binding protein